VKIEGIDKSGDAVFVAVSLRDAGGAPRRKAGNVSAVVDFTAVRLGIAGSVHDEPCEVSRRFRERDFVNRNGVPVVPIELDCEKFVPGLVESFRISVKGDHIDQGDTIHYP